MKTTYLIESDKKEVLGYFFRLKDAKERLEELNNPDYRILCLKGSYFGEGFHRYEVRCLKGNHPAAVFIKKKL